MSETRTYQSQSEAVADLLDVLGGDFEAGPVTYMGSSGLASVNLLGVNGVEVNVQDTFGGRVEARIRDEEDNTLLEALTASLAGMLPATKTERPVLRSVRGGKR